MQFLFPSSMLNPAQVDEHFAWQADLVDSYALVDMDALTSGFGRAFRRLIPGATVVYRGWMLKEDEYKLLEDALRSQGVNMLTSTTQYATAHHLVGWYDLFHDVTPSSIFIDPSREDEIASAGSLAMAHLPSSSFIVKDYVKSRKHEWDTACFAASADRLPSVITEFIRLQDDNLVGDVVVRAFEDFTGAEARVWWVKGEPVVITAHPDTPDNLTVPDLGDVNDLVKALGCQFVTTDFALRADGTWRVVEVGDGQVSDFPASGDFATLANALQSA